MAKRRRGSYYIDNKELQEQLIIYCEKYKKAKAEGTQLPRIPEYVGKAILLIAQKIATSRGFKNYSYIEEMISDGIENVCMYVHNFNPKYDEGKEFRNPNLAFSYISQMMRWTFIRRIKTEKRLQYLTYKNSMNRLIDDQLSPNQILGAPIEMYENIQEFVADYEAKNAKDFVKKGKK